MSPCTENYHNEAQQWQQFLYPVEFNLLQSPGGRWRNKPSFNFV